MSTVATMVDVGDEDRDLAVLVVPRVGAVEATEDVWDPVRLVDAEGRSVAAVAVFLKELQATGRSVATQRVVCDGSVAVVPVRVGGRRCVGSGHPGRGPGFLPLDSVACQAFSRWERWGGWREARRTR